MGGGERVEGVDYDEVSWVVVLVTFPIRIWLWVVVGVRTVIRDWFGVVCHFPLPYLWALVPGCDESVYIVGTLQSFERKEYDLHFGCL